MISRASGYLQISDAPVPAASEQLQRDGFTMLPQVFSASEVAELAAELDEAFDTRQPDIRSTKRPSEQFEPFRYEMVNRSAAVRRAVARREVLNVIEPLLGEDCHIIACTAWRQPPEESQHGGRFWHIDAGPHVPRAADIPWDDRIPYPIFAIAAHIFLIDCPLSSGPTGVIPGSHTSGQAPPRDRPADNDLTWNGQGVMPLPALAGDVALFVSDVWHRRLASGPGDPGRFFQQVHYGRRDIAQRIRPTSDVNHLSAEALDAAELADARGDRRLGRLLGLHSTSFYDG